MSKKNKIPVKPNLLKWAIDRAEMSIPMLAKKFPKIEEWIEGKSHPTLKQLEMFANTVHVAIGFLFLQEPPEETLPIPDFRTIKNQKLYKPSPNLLDTIYLCQQRQDWYRDYAMAYSLNKIDFIGKFTVKDDPVEVAKIIRSKLNISVEKRKNIATWADALNHLITAIEEAGILVMSSSIVGSNSRRKLSVDEFRGFTLADSYAPLIFLNAADSKAAQMFTLAHELAHLWLGESGITDTEALRIPDIHSERWCNNVAAELLMPISETKQEFQKDISVEDQIQSLAKIFKVSSLVVVRRLFDAGFITEAELRELYLQEMKKIRSIKQKSDGGDFYRTIRTRTGKLFARAVLSSAFEGFTLFQDAFRMLGIRKTKTFFEAARKFGVII